MPGQKAGGAAAPCPHSLVISQAGHVQPVVAEAHRAHPAVVGAAREDRRGRGEQVPVDRQTDRQAQGQDTASARTAELRHSQTSRAGPVHRGFGSGD